MKHPNSLWRRDLIYEGRGLRLEVRPMTPDDDVRERDFFDAMTMRERLLRFMGVKNQLLPEEVRQFTHLDFDRDFAIVAVDRNTDSLAGIARYCRDRDDPKTAEAAVAVLQRYQRLGLARYLVTTLFDAAKEYGVRTLVADILRENTASRLLFEKVAAHAGATKRLAQVDFDVCTFEYTLPDAASDNLQERVSECSPKCDVAGWEDRASGPLQFVVDDSRHPRSIWRHDLVFPSGLRVDVRPADPDDRRRVDHFAETVADAGDVVAVEDLQHINFASGFTLVAIDAEKDELASVATFHHSKDWSRLGVVTAKDYQGLGIADFMATEVIRAAASEVLPLRA